MNHKIKLFLQKKILIIFNNRPLNYQINLLMMIIKFNHKKLRHLKNKIIKSNNKNSNLIYGN